MCVGITAFHNSYLVTLSSVGCDVDCLFPFTLTMSRDLICFVLVFFSLSLYLSLSFLFIYLTFSFALSFFLSLLPFYRTNFNCCAFSQSRLPF